jgi:hypothetical protein
LIEKTYKYIQVNSEIAEIQTKSNQAKSSETQKFFIDDSFSRPEAAVVRDEVNSSLNHSELWLKTSIQDKSKNKFH